MGRPSKSLDPSASQEARLGAAIRRRREELGITQEELARAIGFSRPHLALVELGKAHASEELVRRCDEALDADESILLIYPEVVAERARRQRDALQGGIRPRSRLTRQGLRLHGIAEDQEPADQPPPIESRYEEGMPARGVVAAFLGAERRVVITIPLRTLGTGRLVLAHEDVEAAEALARFIRATGIDARLRYVEPTGELDFSPAGLVAICGAKSSPVIAQIIEDHDPLFSYRPDQAGRMWIIDRSSGTRLGSPMDFEFPANQDICYVARLPRPGSRETFLSIGGIHAAGSLGAIHFLTNPKNFRALHGAVGVEPFTMVTSCAFTRAPLRILSSEVVAPPRLHQKSREEAARS